MSKHRKNWSLEEKQTIVSFAKEKGFGQASKEFGVSNVSIRNWAEGFEAEVNPDSPAGLERQLRALKRENEALKRIVADKELAILVKDALLKKSQSLKK